MCLIIYSSNITSYDMLCDYSHIKFHRYLASINKSRRKEILKKY